MTQFFSLFMLEMYKIRKSLVIWIVALLFTIAPIMAGFFTFILQEPQFAKKAGLLSDKAQIIGDATASSYISIHAQMIAVGGIIVYGFITSWTFGREYVDRTIIELLALPRSRTMVVIAKISAVFSTSIVLTLYILVVGFIIGVLINVEGLSLSFFLSQLPYLLIITILTVILSTPVAFFGSFSKGYIAPLGFVFMTLILSQLVAAIGYGDKFPWSIPALLAGITGELELLNVKHFIVIFITFSIGVISTLLWWNYADYDH